MRIDIDKSRAVAKEIVEQANRNRQIEEEAHNAANQVELLNGEISFNEGLVSTLQKVRSLQRSLDAVQRASFDDKLLETVGPLEDINSELVVLPYIRNARIYDTFAAKISDLRAFVLQRLKGHWDSHIRIDTSELRIRIIQNEQGELESGGLNCIHIKIFSGSSRLSLDSVVTALDALEKLDELLHSFGNAFVSMIIKPRLHVLLDGSVSSIEIEGDSICVSERSRDLSAQALFEDLHMIIDFLRSRLPSSIVEPLAGILMPQLVHGLTTIWLASAVPEDLNGLEGFRDTVALVKRFGEALEALDWPGKSQLMEWIADIPNVWARKRRESSLDYVRDLLEKGVGDLETVEYIETRILASDDEILTGNGENDDWNASWSDEEASSVPAATKSNPDRTNFKETGDEDDMSAWGLGEDRDDQEAHDSRSIEGTSEDEAEAWGWGDEDQNDASASKETSRVNSAVAKAKKSNGIVNKTKQQEREITLKETFTITSLPKELVSMITQILSDATEMKTPKFASSPVAPAAFHLLALPGLVLAMYRASCSHIYSRHPSGPMLLYNDSIWLARHLQGSLPAISPLSGVRLDNRSAHGLNLHEDAVALEKFGKRAYAREMESQRTIVIDLLDGAQGFNHCTEHPFHRECDMAVASTIDRLRDLHRQWKTILSRSALLQTIGSLLSGIVNKFIADIEDMSDISEPESQQLTAYCNRIGSLEDLFSADRTSQQSAQQNSVPLTALYTNHWLKFQYLANILESSLVDIKYLWTEGELAMEFDTEELVDLVLALFADSPHRRSAIAEIRGRRGVR